MNYHKSDTKGKPKAYLRTLDPRLLTLGEANVNKEQNGTMPIKEKQLLLP